MLTFIANVFIPAIFYCAIPFLVIYYFLVRKPSNFPPGPSPYPIVGNLPLLGENPHLVFEQLSKKYGPIVGVKFGPSNAICVHGTKLIKEAFNEPAFSGRIQSEGRSFIFGENNGIISAVGSIWNEQRRFALRHLRDFGFGKSSMEELIMDEVNEFMDWLKRKNGSQVNLQDRLSLAVVNSLWRIVTGERFDHDDAKLHKILDEMSRSTRILLEFTSYKTFFILFYPTIGKLFPNWSGWTQLVASKVPRLQMFRQIIGEHKKTLQEDAPRDFVDVYLQETKATTNVKSSFHSKFGEESLMAVMHDLFVAGTDTTSVTIVWVNLFLLHNPRVQKKLHEELDRVVGRTRHVSLKDRKCLPFTEAVILETFRLSSIVPMSVSHSALEDVQFHGYTIPKGTIIYGNTHANHHDPQVWGPDVEEFRPERFLSPDESTVVRHEALMPFSTGRRACLAETLARDTLFLFVANVAQNFEVIVPNGAKKPTLESKQGVAMTPINSTVVMKERTL